MSFGFKLRAFISLIIVFLIYPSNYQSFSQGIAHQSIIQKESSSDFAAKLINLVNQLRINHELNPLNAHPILMMLAQKHAEYMATTGEVTHMDDQGLRPFQRALKAGFPIAGDLERGGFYSENIIMGADLTPEMVVETWLGDEPHKNTMLSEYRSDIGAGVSTMNGYTYYCLDTALLSRFPITPPPIDETNEKSQNNNQAAGNLVAPVIKNTPLPDGSIIHIIKPGETLWTIAAVYGLTVDQLIKQNNLDPQRYIQPEERLMIKYPDPVTATPSVENQTKTAILMERRTDSIKEKQSIVTQTPNSTYQSIRTGTQTPSPSALIALGIAFIILVIVIVLGFKRPIN